MKGNIYIYIQGMIFSNKTKKILFAQAYLIRTRCICTICECVCVCVLYVHISLENNLHKKTHRKDKFL